MNLRVDGLTVALRRPLGSAMVVLDSVSLALAAGEALCLAGESGAGKSLLCQAIVGMLPAAAHVASGEVWLQGRRIDHLNAARLREVWGRQIAWLPQDAGATLDPMVSIGGQIEETLIAHGRSKGQARADAVAWLDRVGLPDPERQARSFAHRSSGGMRQRAALALALCTEPRVVVADEPTSALDAITRNRIAALLRSLCAGRETALLMVTHDLHLAHTADRLAVLYAGRIVESGPAAAVLAAPSHPYTRALTGCQPRLGDRRERLTVIPGAMPPLGDPARRQGCVFAPRCPEVFERCRRETPELARPANGAAAESACFRTSSHD